MDYCSALSASLPVSTYKALQMIHKLAAHLLFNQSKRFHAIFLLVSLHCLPVAAYFRFKYLILALRIATGNGASYLKVPFCNLESVNEGHKTFLHNEAPLLLCNGMNCLPSPITYLFLKHFSKPQRLSLSACALCFRLCTNVYIQTWHYVLQILLD